MIRELTCIVCPRGCQLRVELDGTRVVSVTGQICPRGKRYAEEECTHPLRTVTSTVRLSNGGVLSVKTERAIPKENVFDCMKRINGVVAKLPIKAGDIIIEDLFGTNVIATEDAE